MTPVALGSRLRTRLHQWQAEGRIGWQDFADLEADALDDMARAVERQVADLELEAAWNGHIVWTRQRMALYDMFDKLLDPRRVA